METASGNKLVKFPGAVTAFGKGLVGKFLKGFFDRAAFFTLILINGHKFSPEKVM
jgi:hypothetical protein